MDASSVWTLIFLWAFVSRSPVTGEFTMIGSSQPITAVPGDDVILPCRLDPALDVEGFAVEWSNPDLRPDPSDLQGWVDFVFLYRYGREDLHMKLQSYVNRTLLFAEELKHGNISLKILNVTSADAGRYKCLIPKLEAHSIVELVVDPDLRTGTTETSSYSGDLQTPEPRDETEGEDVDQTRLGVWILPLVFCFFVLVLILLVTGFVITRQRQTLKHKCDVECDVALSNQPPG